MKTLFSLALICLVTITASIAQVSLKSVYSNTTDTVTDGGTKVISLALPGFHSSVTLQADITKISGTLAGTLTPVVSNDGVTYYAIPVINSADSAKSVTNVASQGAVYKMPTGFLYYGFRWTGSGTMSGIIKGTCIPRK